MAGRVPSIQGKQYTNRRDLQNAPTRQPAPQPGPTAPAARAPQAGPAARMPQGNPLGLTPPPQPPQASVPAGGAPAPQTPAAVDFTMESVPNMSDPSQRPDENVLTGVTHGFERDGAADPLAIRLRAAYMADPDPALMQMILGLEQGNQEATGEWDGAQVAGGNRFSGVW